MAVQFSRRVGVVQGAVRCGAGYYVMTHQAEDVGTERKVVRGSLFALLTSTLRIDFRSAVTSRAPPASPNVHYYYVPYELHERFVHETLSLCFVWYHPLRRGQGAVMSIHCC